MRRSCCPSLIGSYSRSWVVSWQQLQGWSTVLTSDLAHPTARNIMVRAPLEILQRACESQEPIDAGEHGEIISEPLACDHARLCSQLSDCRAASARPPGQHHQGPCWSNQHFLQRSTPILQPGDRPAKPHLMLHSGAAGRCVPWVLPAQPGWCLLQARPRGALQHKLHREARLRSLGVS